MLEAEIKGNCGEQSDNKKDDLLSWPAGYVQGSLINLEERNGRNGRNKRHEKLWQDRISDQATDFFILQKQLYSKWARGRGGVSGLLELRHGDIAR